MTDDRPLGQSLRRGLALRCPCCGNGSLLERYLAVRPNCPSCGEDFTPQRADDGPAYLTILVVGHLMVPLIHFGFTTWRPEPLVMAAALSTVCVGLSLALLPRMKGLMVAIQWARRMHGFAPPPGGPAPRE